ncbi:MAG: 3-deoxy-7-phosphoheptulonate synthase, partial [Candidatus Aenigmarchaeota archaeon]|nr:3-deoxy-7-phosphoheptulonate synthase [Candidatus Aenigmarchaeota archaeon]
MISMSFHLASREYKKSNTTIRVDSVMIGKEFVVIAGPCAIESRKQFIAAAEAVKKAGAAMLRGPVFKPRSSPYSFQGIGEAGLEILKEARQLMPVVT